MNDFSISITALLITITFCMLVGIITELKHLKKLDERLKVVDERLKAVQEGKCS